MSKLKDITLEIDGQIVGLQQLIDHYTGAAFHPGAPAARAYALYKSNEQGGEDFHAALWHPQTIPSKDEVKISGYFIPDRTNEPEDTIDKLVYDISTRLTSVLTRHHLLLPPGSLEQIRVVIEKSVSHHALNVNLWKHEVQIAAMRLGISDLFNGNEPHDTLKRLVHYVENAMCGTEGIGDELEEDGLELTKDGLTLMLDDRPVEIGSILYGTDGAKLEVINIIPDGLEFELTLYEPPIFKTGVKVSNDVGLVRHENLFCNGMQRLFWEPLADELKVTDHLTLPECLMLDDRPVVVGSILYNSAGSRLEVLSVNLFVDSLSRNLILSRELILHHYPYSGNEAAVGTTIYEDLFYEGEQQLFWEAPTTEPELEVADSPTLPESLGLLSQYQDEGLIVVEVPLTGAANNGEWRAWLVTKGDGHSTRVYRWNNQVQIERDESDSTITITQHTDESKVGTLFTDSLLAYVMMEIEKDAKGLATLSEVQDDPTEFNEEEDELEVVDLPKEEDGPFPGEIFRHVDGGYYRYLMLTKSTEDQSILVNYEHIWPFTVDTWTRPFEEWTKRFTKVTEESLAQAMQEDRKEFQNMVLCSKEERRSREHKDQNADAATEVPAYSLPEGWRSEDHENYTAYRYAHKDGDIVLRRDHGDEDVDCMTHPVASMINWNYTNLEIAVRESLKYLPGWERAPFGYIGCTPILLTTPVFDAQGKRWMPVGVGEDRAINLIHTYGDKLERWNTTVFVDGKQVLFIERPLDPAPVEIPICQVEGRPVYNDSILYDAEGNEWRVTRTLGHDKALCLTRTERTDKLVAHTAWVTNPMVDGQTILFWDKPEIEVEGDEVQISELEWQTGFRNGLQQVWFAETEDQGTIRVVPEANHWVIQDVPGIPNHKQAGYSTYEKAINAANRQWAAFQQGGEQAEGVEDEPA